jgi:hypothetical protein
LEFILKIISQDSYHSHKISWPMKIYNDLWWLMQVCKQSQNRDNKWVWVVSSNF